MCLTTACLGDDRRKHLSIMSHLLLFKSGSCILTVNTCSLHLHECLAGSSEGPSPWHKDPRKVVRDTWCCFVVMVDPVVPVQSWLKSLWKVTPQWQE